MKKKDGNKLFWISYSDLMTSLFFVILVLFSIVTVEYLKSNPKDLPKIRKENAELKKKVVELSKKNGELEGKLGEALINIKEQEKYINIVKQFRPLKESGHFVYLKKSSKYVAKDFLGIEIFNPDDRAIKVKYRDKTVAIGREVEKILKNLKKENPDYSYILVIEGNTANTYDKHYNKDSNYGYTLSYGRALAVYQLWCRNGIDLRKYNTEVLICGSGFNGWDRDKDEENNKRFSIQIVPKIKDPTLTINKEPTNDFFDNFKFK